MAGPLKGGGDKSRAFLSEKKIIPFLILFHIENKVAKIRIRLKIKKKKNPMTTKPEGGGYKGLSGPTTKKTLFCGFPLPVPPTARFMTRKNCSSNGAILLFLINKWSVFNSIDLHIFIKESSQL